MKRANGFTLVEVLVSLLALGFVMSLLSVSLVDLFRQSSISSSQNNLGRQARHCMDVLSSDIQESALVLKSVTINTDTYTSDESTLILQAPSVDAAGSILAANDIIVYRRTGSKPPYTLLRTVVPSASSMRSAIRNEVAASNVKSIVFAYTVNYGFSGDGLTKSYGLPCTPFSSNIEVIQNGVQLAGTDFSLVPSNMLKFVSAPSTGASVNAVFSASPSDSASQITSVSAALAMEMAGPEYGRNHLTLTVKSMTQAALRNH